MVGTAVTPVASDAAGAVVAAARVAVALLTPAEAEVGSSALVTAGVAVVGALERVGADVGRSVLVGSGAFVAAGAAVGSLAFCV